MTYYIKDVQAFHDKFGLATPPLFVFLPDDLYKFRVGFFNEELQEYIDAYAQKDMSTAVDSLVDLIYIICGCALLHGLDHEKFYHAIDCLGDADVPIFESDEGPTDKPKFFSRANHERFIGHLKGNIAAYEDAHAANSEHGIREALAVFYLNVLLGAADMGITQACWDELWTDVQRANMSKVRAEKASDSKRGSQWDVVKPAGWVPPQTDAIMKKHAAG
jgi:predicted HAD superfamily Cof-like phosphohydrolase